LSSWKVNTVSAGTLIVPPLVKTWVKAPPPAPFVDLRTSIAEGGIPTVQR
jgi:hypothetical protein